MLHTVIAHTNSLSLALGMQFLQRLPQLLSPGRSRARAVNQEQINITARSTDLLHAGQQLVVGLLGRAGGAQDLGSDEDFVAGDAGRAQGLADFAFIAVELRGVDVSVSHFQGLEGGLDALGGRRTVDTEAEARNADGGVGEGQAIGRFDRHFWRISGLGTRGEQAESGQAEEEREGEVGDAEARAVERLANFGRLEGGANRTRWNDIIRRLLTPCGLDWTCGFVRCVMLVYLEVLQSLSCVSLCRGSHYCIY